MAIRWKLGLKNLLEQKKAYFKEVLDFTGGTLFLHLKAQDTQGGLLTETLYMELMANGESHGLHLLTSPSQI